MRIKSEPEEESSLNGGAIEPEVDMPTDLSMSSMNQSMSNMSQSMSSMSSPVNEPPQQPLSLLDPPVKYRNHAYNLVKTDQEAEERK